NETDDKAGYYARRSDLEKAAFMVPRATVETLKESLVDLTVFSFKPGQVKTVKVSRWSPRGRLDTLELTRKSAAEWTGKDREGAVKVNARLAELLVQDLTGLRATTYVRYEGGPEPAEGLDVKKGAVEIEVALDTKETVTLTLGAATKGG